MKNDPKNPELSTADMRFAFVNGSYVGFEKPMLTEYPIVFSYPKDNNPYRKGSKFIIWLLQFGFNIFLIYTCVSLLRESQDPQLFWCSVFFLALGCISILVVIRVFILKRTIYFDEKSIRVTYSFVGFMNWESDLQDCIGYLPYSKQVNISGGRIPKYSTSEGLVLGFKKRKPLKINLILSDDPGRIPRLKKLLDSKGIKDFTDKNYSRFSSFSNVISIAKKKFERARVD